MLILISSICLKYCGFLFKVVKFKICLRGFYCFVFPASILSIFFCFYYFEIANKGVVLEAFASMDLLIQPSWACFADKADCKYSSKNQLSFSFIIFFVWLNCYYLNKGLHILLFCWFIEGNIDVVAAVAAVVFRVIALC